MPRTTKKRLDFLCILKAVDGADDPPRAGLPFLFFSREEPRVHVPVICADGEAKFWLEPEIELAKNYRLTRSQLREAEEIIEEHRDEFRAAWNRHFGS